MAFIGWCVELRVPGMYVLCPFGATNLFHVDYFFRVVGNSGLLYKNYCSRPWDGNARLQQGKQASVVAR